MATKVRFLHVFAVLLSFLAIASKAAAAQNGYAVEGRVKGQGMGAGVFLSKNSHLKLIWNGGERVTYVRPDGYFAFQGVSAGTHLLEVSGLGYYFSPVRVDVSARLHGQVRAVAVETRKSDALKLDLLREEYYYEKREPFSVMSLLKSPTGLMVGFMLVAVFLLPKLTNNIDPEETRRVQEEERLDEEMRLDLGEIRRIHHPVRNQPSFSSLL